MRMVINHLMAYRARRLVSRLSPHIDSGAAVLDIGCGTGHNAVELQKRAACSVQGVDVSTMQMVGDPPIVFDGLQIPIPDNSYDITLLLFVLHYSPDPTALLSEIRRVCSGRLLVMQSTYSGQFALNILKFREYVQGRGALKFAQKICAVSPTENTLNPQTYFQRGEILKILEKAGWRLISHAPQYTPFTALSRDLFVLE